MTTENAKQLALDNKEYFIQWAKDWHGQCDLKCCDIQCALTNYRIGGATFDELFEAVADTDGDWESFEYYVENNKNNA